MTTTGDVTKVEALPVPQVSYGAGKSMGLSLMLYADYEKYFMTSAFFEGFKVLVHNPDEFPQVKQKGFVIGPGKEMFAAVDAFGTLKSFCHLSHN